MDFDGRVWESLGSQDWVLVAPSEAWDQGEAETVAAPSEGRQGQKRVAPSEERRFQAAPSEAQRDQVEAVLEVPGLRQLDLEQ